MKLQHLLFLLSVIVLGGGAAFFVFSGSGDASVAEFTKNELEVVQEDPLELDAMIEQARDTAAPDERRTQDVAEVTTNKERTILELEGRVITRAGAGVANAEVALYVRRSFSAMRRSDWRSFGRGRGRGRGGRDAFRLVRVAKTVNTDSQGHFAFRGPVFSDSTLDIAVKPVDHAPAVVRREWKVQDGTLELKDIVVDVGANAVGMVRSTGGSALAGAKLTYRVETRGRRGRGNQSRTIEELVDPALTKADGSFELRHIPIGRFRLEVTLEKYIPTSTDRLEAKESQRIDLGVIALEIGTEVTGIVRDTKGRPIADAEVTAQASRDAFRRAFQGFGRGNGNQNDNQARGTRGQANRGQGNRGQGNRGQGNPGQGNRRGRGRGSMFAGLAAFRDGGASTKTDSHGRFTIDSLPKLSLRVEVRHPKYIDEDKDPVEPGTGQPVIIEMYRRLAVTGVVVDHATSAPVELYGITARRVDAPDFMRGFGRNRGRGGPRGRRGGGDPNSGNTRGGNPGGGADTGGNAGRRGRRSASRQGGGQFGGFGGEDREARQARERAYLEARLGPGGEIPRDTIAPTSHPDGKFTLEGLQAGEFVFDVDAPGYAKSAIGRFKLERGKQVPNVTLRVVRGVPVKGTVVDKDTNQALADAEVELLLPPLPEVGQTRNDNPFGRMFGRGRNRDGFRLDLVRTNSSGHFDLGTRRPGQYVLKVRRTGYRAYSNASLMLAIGRSSDLTITLSQGARVYGTVTNIDPDERYTVTLVSDDNTPTETDVEPNGHYEIRGLAAGGYRVRVESRSQRADFRGRAASMFASREARPDLVVADGSSVQYDIDAGTSNLATVSGNVLHNGQPGANLEVRLEMAQDPNANADQMQGFVRRLAGRFLRDNTDDQGKFEIETIPPGTYTLEVRAGGRGRGGRGGPGGRRGGGGSLIYREPLQLAEGQQVTRQITITTASLTLHFEDKKTGKPITSARVEMVLEEDAAGKKPSEWRRIPSRQSASIRDGVARFDSLALGNYLFVITARNQTYVYENGTSAKDEPERVYVGAGDQEKTLRLTTPSEAEKAKSKQNGAKK